MKPGRSLATTGVLPSVRANAQPASTASGSVSSVRTTSTSCITGTGLKKCRPRNRCGRRVATAISVMLSEEVLLANSVSGGQTASSARNSSSLTCFCSVTASITRSQAASCSSSVVPRRRARIASRSPFSSRCRATARSSRSSIACRPRCSVASSTSRTIVSRPAVAVTCAIPPPIRPQPTTPTLRTCIADVPPLRPIPRTWRCPGPRRCRRSPARARRRGAAARAAPCTPAACPSSRADGRARSHHR